MYATWIHGNPLSIKFVGIGEQFKKFVDNLVEDFNEPKFGYNGELWDEDENPELDYD